MARAIAFAIVTLAAAACSHQPSYAVRLDLDQIAVQTATRDTVPGFASLAR
ncbi:MAG: hypothetical protein ABIT09_03540 [Croceibacterium sp.]